MYFPVDPHMQRPPRGGIWVGITCDISKSNCKLSNYHYSDSITLDNTVQIIIHHIDEYDNIHQFVWTSTHLIAVITYFPAGLQIYIWISIRSYLLVVKSGNRYCERLYILYYTTYALPGQRLTFGALENIFD
ncbi:hypothetical protein V1478_012392 [Vespula squamosa]|uniref:Uncharacterized protein n=1 Tax=Vespula squamosa TaxID=30214 RepID=A0ABD2AD47_VESSQ